LEKRFSATTRTTTAAAAADVPVRTSIGAMAIAFYMVLTLASINESSR